METCRIAKFVDNESRSGWHPLPPLLPFIMIKTVEIHEWERWYAWFPVIIVSGTNFPYKRTTVWREYVERKYWGNWAGGGYEYRLEATHDDR